MLYLDDLHPGMQFRSGEQSVERAEIEAFARQYDPQPFHLDPQAASQSVFGTQVASGWHTAALTMRLLVDGGLPIAGGVVGLQGELAWPAPVYPGDVLRVDSEVLELRPSRSRPERGVVRVRSVTRKQSGQIVQTLIAEMLVFRRPAAARVPTP